MYGTHLISSDSVHAGTRRVYQSASAARRSTLFQCGIRLGSREDEGARRAKVTADENDNYYDDDDDGDDNDACHDRGKSSLLFRVLESLTEEEPKLTRVCGSRETLSPSPSAGAGGGALLRPRASD